MTHSSAITQQPSSDGHALNAYTAKVEALPLLGYIVMYSIFDGKVTHQDVEQWVRELKLDPKMVPAPVTPASAFRRVTGPNGVRVSYPLNDPSNDPSTPSRPGSGHQVTLMVREVHHDRRKIVKRLVREEASAAGGLNYDTRLGEVTFVRDRSRHSDRGEGTLHIKPDHQAISELPIDEQIRVRDMFDKIKTTHQQMCLYLPGDKLRSMIHDAVENLGAVPVRPTGGVYFVHRRHAETLSALKELVRRFGPQGESRRGSKLSRIPLLNNDEMREDVVDSFRHKAKEDLQKLSQAIVEARRNGDTSQSTMQDLYAQFRNLKAATAEHSELLSTDLQDTTAALDLARSQLENLFKTA